MCTKMYMSDERFIAAAYERQRAKEPRDYVPLSFGLVCSWTKFSIPICSIKRI